MKNSILNLGKALDKKEQREISGGWGSCYTSNDCLGPYDCCSFGQCIISAHAFMEPYCS